MDKRHCSCCGKKLDYNKKFLSGRNCFVCSDKCESAVLNNSDGNRGRSCVVQQKLFN